MTSSNYPASPEKYPYPTEVKFRDFVPIKLCGSSNYSKWRKLMLRLIETQELVGFINGEVAASAPVDQIIPIADYAAHIKSADYRTWKKSDALLQSWIIGSINEDLFGIVEDLRTARAMWTTLETVFKDFPAPTRNEYPYPLEVNARKFVPIRLSKGNYQEWRSLMLGLVENQGLGDFINGEAQPPPKMITVPNPNGSAVAGSNTEATESVSDQASSFESADADTEEIQSAPNHDHSSSSTTRSDGEELENVSGDTSEVENAPHGNSTNNRDREEIDGNGNGSYGDHSTLISRQAKQIENHDYKLWIKSDGLLRSWMLGTISEDLIEGLVDCKTAREMWVKLEENMESSDSESETDTDIEEKDAPLCKSLYRAAIKGEWKSVEKVLKEKPEAVRFKITRKSETLLMVALMAGQSHQFLWNLLKHMSKDDLAITNSYKISALHRAAIEGNVEAAKWMVKMNPDLPNLSADGVHPPLFYAAGWGRRDMTLYLLQVTREDFILKDDEGVDLVMRLVRNGIYDVALQLVKRYKLASKSSSLLELLAGEATAFPSGTRFNWWQSLIYHYVPLEVEEVTYDNGGGDIENPTAVEGFFSVLKRKVAVVLWKLTEKLVPQMKQIQEKKLMHSQAVELLKHICVEIEKLNRSAEMIVKAFDVAVDIGIYEVIEEILASFPSGFYRHGISFYKIFHMAIACRNEKVFNLIYQFPKEDRAFFLSQEDEFENNGLHLAGNLRNEQRLELRIKAAGAALQMQRELQWFKEVEKLLTIRDRQLANKDNKTPIDLFTETHKDLVKEGEQWMKDTATSCTIVAALIVTITFAAAITVPGGNHGDSGFPIFSRYKAFKVFGISDALALFTSTSSVLILSSILTSRYAEGDFLSDLPKKLILGLVTLFASIISMMVSFSVAFYLVFGDGKIWILIPVIAFSCVTVILFAFLQFPLLFEMIRSTYFSPIFGEQSNRVLM